MEELELIRRTKILVQMKLRKKQEEWRNEEKTIQNAQEQAILTQLNEYLDSFKRMLYQEPKTPINESNQTKRKENSNISKETE